MTEYIEREAVLQKIRGYRGFFQDNPSSDHMLLKMEAKNIIKDQESADVAPVVHGKWKFREIKNGVRYWTCSNCRNRINTWWAHDRYCSDCGAKMDLKHE